jgi:hypothetical protein
MLQYNIRAHIAVHEGETKFYQLYEIDGPGGSVCVRHWGRYHPGAELLPYAHGSVSISTSASRRYGHRECTTMMKTKMKRGYNEFRINVHAGNVDEDQVRAILNAHFKRPDFLSIMMAIQAKGTRAEAVLPSEKSAEKPKVVEEDVDRGPAWGTW